MRSLVQLLALICLCKVLGCAARVIWSSDTSETDAEFLQQYISQINYALNELYGEHPDATLGPNDRELFRLKKIVDPETPTRIAYLDTKSEGTRRNSRLVELALVYQLNGRATDKCRTIKVDDVQMTISSGASSEVECDEKCMAKCIKPVFLHFQTICLGDITKLDDLNKSCFLKTCGTNKPTGFFNILNKNKSRAKPKQKVHDGRSIYEDSIEAHEILNGYDTDDYVYAETYMPEVSKETNLEGEEYDVPNDKTKPQFEEKSFRDKYYPHPWAPPMLGSGTDHPLQYYPYLVNYPAPQPPMLVNYPVKPAMQNQLPIQFPLVPPPQVPLHKPWLFPLPLNDNTIPQDTITSQAFTVIYQSHSDSDEDYEEEEETELEYEDFMDSSNWNENDNLNTKTSGETEYKENTPTKIQNFPSGTPDIDYESPAEKDEEDTADPFLLTPESSQEDVEQQTESYGNSKQGSADPPTQSSYRETIVEPIPTNERIIPRLPVIKPVVKHLIPVALIPANPSSSNYIEPIQAFPKQLVPVPIGTNQIPGIPIKIKIVKTPSQDTSENLQDISGNIEKYENYLDNHDDDDDFDDDFDIETIEDEDDDDDDDDYEDDAYEYDDVNKVGIQDIYDELCKTTEWCREGMFVGGNEEKELETNGYDEGLCTTEGCLEKTYTKGNYDLGTNSYDEDLCTTEGCQQNMVVIDSNGEEEFTPNSYVEDLCTTKECQQMFLLPQEADTGAKSTEIGCEEDTYTPEEVLQEEVIETDPEPGCS